MAMASVNPFHRVARNLKGPVMIVRSYGECWLWPFPQHGPGPKHLRTIALRDWQTEIVEREPRAFLTGLMHSDGCRFDRVVNGKAHPAYEFTNRSLDILTLFGETCDHLDVHYTRPSAVDISIARRRDVAILDEFIGPKT